MSSNRHDSKGQSAWDRVLDSLELELDITAALLEGDSAQFPLQGGPRWELPPDLGTMPDDLVFRAHSIRRRQELALHHLQSAATLAQQRQTYVEHISGAVHRHPSAFIDQEA
ncbi:MAG: hypothetical protein WC005_05915 [Candidatus Nanopelagicales bacterium]